MKATEKGLSYAQRRKNLAAIEQMCGILLLMMQRVQDDALQRELEGLLKGVQAAEPSGALEIRRIDRYIISKLDEIKLLLDEKYSKDKIMSIAADIGLQLLERKMKTVKSNTR